MSWAQDEWKNSLSHEAFQKVNTLEKVVEQLRKDQQQRKFQLESLEVTFKNQKTKTEEQKSQVALYRKEIQQLEEQCRVTEVNREKTLHDLQNKESQLRCIDGQLSKLKQNLEKETNKCSKITIEYEREIHSKNKLIEQLEQKENEIKKLERRLKPADDVFLNEGSKTAAVDMLISFDDSTVDVNKTAHQGPDSTANLLDFTPAPTEMNSKLSSGSQNSCSIDIFGVEQNTLDSNPTTHQDMDELKASITDLQSKLHAHHSELTAYQQEKKELLLKFEQLNADLKDKSTACLKAENEAHKLTASVGDKQMRCDELEQSLKQIQQQYDCERHNSQAALKAQEERMKQQEKNMREELLRDQQIAKNQVNEVQHILSEAEKKYNASIRDYKSLERMQYQLNHEKETLVQQLEEYKQNISNMKSDHQHLVAEVRKEMDEAHKKEITSYDIRLQEKLREVAVNSSEISKQKEEISHLNKSLVEAHERCSHLEDSKNQAEKRVSQLTIAMEEGNHSSLLKFKEMEKQLSTKLQDKVEHSKLLAQSLEENTRKLDDVTKELATKKQQFEDTKFKFDSSEATLAKLKKEKNDIQKEYNSFIQDTKNRETELLTALEKSQHDEKLMKERESFLNNAVAKLEHQLQSSKDNFTEFTKDSDLKEVQIGKLTDQLEILQKTLTEQLQQIQCFNAVKVEMENEKDKLRDDSDNLKTLVERLNKENDFLKAKNEEICSIEERYKSEICNLKICFEAEKEELEKVVQHHKETESMLQKDLAAKESCIEEGLTRNKCLSIDFQQAEEVLNEKLKMITEKDCEVQKLKAGLDDMKNSHVVEKEQFEAKYADVMTKLDQALEVLRCKTNEVKQMEKDFQEQYSSLKIEIQVRTEECDNYLEQIKQLQESVEALQQIKARNEASMEMFVEDHECLLNEKNELSKHYEAAQEELKDLHTRVNNLSLQKEDMATALTGKDEEIRQLHEKQTRFEQDCHMKDQELRNSVSELTSRCEELENDVTTLMSQKNYAEKHLDKFQEQNETISHELSSLSVLYEQLKTENAQLSVGIQTTNTKLEESADILQSKESKIEDLVAQIDDLRDDLQMKTKTYEDLTTEHQHLQIHLDTIQEELNSKSALLAEKQIEVDALNDRSSSELNSMSSLLDERNQEISELRSNVEELERKIVELNKLISEKEEKLRDAYETIKSLESQLERAVCEVKESAVEKGEMEAQLKDAIISLEDSKSVIQEKNELALNLQRDVDQIRSEMHEKLADRNKEIEILSNSLEQSERTAQNLQDLLAAKDGEHKELLDNLQNLTEELESSNCRLDEQNTLLEQQKTSVSELSERREQNELLYESAKKQIADLESQIECSEQKISSLSVDMRATQENGVVLEKELESIKMDFQNTSENCIYLREQLENKTSHAEKLVTDLQKVSEQMNKFECETKRLSEENYSLENALLVSKEMCSNVEKERDELLKKVNEKVACIESMGVAVKSYEENEVALKYQLEIIAKQEVEKINLKEEKINLLKENVRSLDERLQQQLKDTEEMNSTILNQKLICEQQEKQQKDLIGELSNLKNGKETLQHELETKENELNDLLNQAEETDELVMNLKAENDSLSLKYQQTVEQINISKEEIFSLKERVKEINEELNIKLNQNKDLEEEAAKQKGEHLDEISSCKLQLDHLQKELSTLMVDKEFLQKELTTKENDLSNMQNQAEETDELVMNLRLEMGSLENKFKEEQARHLKENGQLQESLNKKQGQIKGLFDGKNALQEKIVAFASQIDMLQNKIKRGKEAYEKDYGTLKEQIASLESKLAEKIANMEALTLAGEEMKITHDNVVCELRSQQNTLTEEFNTFKKSSEEHVFETQNNFNALLEERDKHISEKDSQLQSLRESYEIASIGKKQAVEEHEAITNELKNEITQCTSKIESLRTQLHSTEQELDRSRACFAELTIEKDKLSAELSDNRTQNQAYADSHAIQLQENAERIASLQNQLEIQKKMFSEELESVLLKSEDCKQASVEKEVENSNLLCELKGLEKKYDDMRLQHDEDVQTLRSCMEEKDHAFIDCKDRFEKEKIDYINCKQSELKSVQEQLEVNQQELVLQKENYGHLQQKYELFERSTDVKIKELNEEIVEKLSKIDTLSQSCKEQEDLLSDLRNQVEGLELKLKNEKEVLTNQVEEKEVLTNQVEESKSEIDHLIVLINEKCDMIHSLEKALQDESEEKMRVVQENEIEKSRLKETVEELTRVKDQDNAELKCEIEKLDEELTQLKIKRDQDMVEVGEKQTMYELEREKLIADKNEAVSLKEHECDGLRLSLQNKEERISALDHQLTKLEKEKCCLNEELNAERKVVEDADREKSDLKCNIEKLTEQVVSLKRQKNDAESEVNNARNEISTLQAYASECQGKLDETARVLEDCQVKYEDSMRQHSEEKTDSHQKLKAAENLKNEVTDELKECKISLTDVKDAILTLSEQREKLYEKNEELQKQIQIEVTRREDSEKTRQDLVSELENDLVNRNECVSNYRREIDDLKEQLLSSHQQLEELAVEKGEAITKIEELQTKVDAKESKYLELQSDYDVVQQTLSKNEEALRENDLKISSLSDELTTKENILEKLEASVLKESEERVAMRLELEELRGSYEKTKVQIDVHAKTELDYKTQIETIEKELNDQKDSMGYVETIKEELMAQLEVARKKLDDEKSNKNETRDKIEAQSETIRSLTETIRSLTGELASAKESIEYVNTIKDEITQQLTGKSAEYETLASKFEKEKDTSIEKIESLERDIDKLKDEKEHFENEKNKLKICFDTLHQEKNDQYCELLEYKRTSEELCGQLQTKVNELREMDIRLGNEKEDIVRYQTDISRLKVGNEDMKTLLEVEKRKLKEVQLDVEKGSVSIVELEKGLEDKCIALEESERKIKETLLKLHEVERDLTLEKEKGLTKQTKLEQIKTSLLRSQPLSVDGEQLDSGSDSLNESIDFNSYILQLQEQNAKLEKEKKKYIEEAVEEEKVRIVEASKQFVLDREKENELKNQDLIDNINLQEKKIETLQQKLSQQEEECRQLEFNIQKQKETYEVLLKTSEEEKKNDFGQELIQGEGSLERLQELLDETKLVNEELRADFTKVADEYERAQKREAREIEKLKKQCEKFKSLCEKKDNELKSLRAITKDPLKSEKMIEDLREELAKSDGKYVDFQFKNEDLMNELKDLKLKKSSELEALNKKVTSLLEHNKQLRQKLDEALNQISQLEIENTKLKKELLSHPFNKNNMISPLARTLSSMNFLSSGDDEVKTDSEGTASDRVLDTQSQRSILKKSSETPKRNLDVSESISLKNTKRTRLHTVIEVSDGTTAKTSPVINPINRRRSARLSQKPYQREVMSASSSDEEVLNKQITDSTTSHPVKENPIKTHGNRGRNNDVTPLSARKDNISFNNTLNCSKFGAPSRVVIDKTAVNTLKNAGPSRVTRLSTKLETNDTMMMTRQPLSKVPNVTEEEKCNMQ